MNRTDEDGVSRRGVFKRSLLGLAGAYGAGVAQPAEAGNGGKYPKDDHGTAKYDLTAQSGALKRDRIVESACQFCNSNCRLKVHVKAGRVIDVTGRTRSRRS